jgi:hypothetical protein
MKKYLLSSVVIAALATPVFAADAPSAVDITAYANIVAQQRDAANNQVATLLTALNKAQAQVQTLTQENNELKVQLKDAKSKEETVKPTDGPKAETPSLPTGK